MRCVILGNSAAAVGCAEQIRKHSQAAQIAMISSEPHHTYSRPLISYLLQGKTDEQKMRYRPDAFYQALNIAPMLGRAAVSVDPEAKIVALSGGERVSYDKLLVATGSVPFVPPVEGLDGVKNKCCFLTLDDARALMALPRGSRALVLGAGLIGLKCAEGLSARGVHVTALDLSETVLPSALPPDAARIVQRHIEAQGVRLLLGDAAVRAEEGVAHLRSGGRVPFDQIVIAVGVRPNVALLREAGAEIGRGIAVDGCGRTSLPDIYAAGDCAEGVEYLSGQRRVLALLPNAYHQGAAAGAHMVGERFDAPPAIAMNALGLWGLHALGAGNYEGERYIRQGGGNYRMLCTRDDRLQGFVLIGDVARAGIYTQLIRERTPLSSIDFAHIRDDAGLIAFSAGDRKKKLGGAAS